MTTTVNDEPGAGERRHVLQDLGWAMTRSGDALRGSATLVPEMLVPGAEHLRLSILAIWADVMAGTLAASTIHPASRSRSSSTSTSTCLRPATASYRARPGS